MQSGNSGGTRAGRSAGEQAQREESSTTSKQRRGTHTAREAWKIVSLVSTAEIAISDQRNAQAHKHWRQTQGALYTYTDETPQAHPDCPPASLSSRANTLDLSLLDSAIIPHSVIDETSSAAVCLSLPGFGWLFVVRSCNNASEAAAEPAAICAGLNATPVSGLAPQSTALSSRTHCASLSRTSGGARTMVRAHTPRIHSSAAQGSEERPRSGAHSSDRTRTQLRPLTAVLPHSARMPSPALCTGDSRCAPLCFFKCRADCS